MNLTKLFSDSQFNKDKAIYIYSDGVETFSTVRKYRDEISVFLLELQSKCVSIVVSSNSLLAKWLILLDGLVSRITIIPSELSKKELAYFIKISGSNILLTDNDDLIEKSNFFNILKLKKDTKVALRYNCETEWVLATSGTTGTPKLVKHTLKSLIYATKTGSTKRDIWGLLYSLQRFSGLQVFFQSILSGGCLVITEGRETIYAQVSLLVRCGVTCLSATPTLWRKLLMIPRFRELGLKTITLGGEISNQFLLSALSKQFPDAKICHIYASTETGSVFSVGDKKEGFPLSYMNGKLDNIELKISNNDTLMIRSKSRASGYVGVSESFDIGDDSFIDTGDLISVTEDRCYFCGRRNGAINVGGNKVQPESIEKVLMSINGVVDAMVSARESSISGSLVQAEIVVDSSVKDQKEFSKLIRKITRSNLDDFMVPALIKYVSDIRINSNGKVVRK